MPSGGPLRIVGVVPAAGASRRMGRAKAALELDGRSFVQRAVDALGDGGCDEVIVVVPEGDAVVHAAALATGARVVTNPDPGEGPITSMRLAIGSLPGDADGIAWLPVDFPLVDAGVVSELRALAARERAPLTLPVLVTGEGRTRGHPPILGRSLFAELLDPELEGGARTVVHRHLAEAAFLETSDPGVVTDVDTPDEYRALGSP